MGTAAFIFPLVALSLGPWIGLGASAAPAVESASDSSFVRGALVVAPPAEAAAPKGARGHTECNCRTVDVTLDNVVRDVEVKTGDARVVNFNVTYVSAEYGDRDVDIDQEAEAITGDAIAGQLIAVDARGPGCVNVRVSAKNHVEDAEVESGDATAINRSIVLLDPGVSRGDLDIDIEQEAEAHSGDAIAGQVIGVVGGNRIGGCGGGVDLKALNEVLRTDVETGRARFHNFSEIRTCSTPGCEAELRGLLGGKPEVEVCSASRCRDVDSKELAATLAEEAAVRPDPEGESNSDLNAAESACSNASPTPAATPKGKWQHHAAPSPTPTPENTPAASEAAASPSISPESTPVPCPTSTSQPQGEEAGLVAERPEATPEPAA